jgi:hypothetical protein
MVVWGGPSDTYYQWGQFVDPVYESAPYTHSIHLASIDFADRLLLNGHLVVRCDHGGGHTPGPVSYDPDRGGYVWPQSWPFRYLYDHVRGQPSPYATSFPAGTMPSSCTLPTPPTPVEVLFSTVASINDEPRDGLGDSFWPLPAPNPYLLVGSDRELRGIMEFDLSAFAGNTIRSARLVGAIHENNALYTGPRDFTFVMYTANGISDLGDFEIGGALVGTTSFSPPNEVSVWFDIDVTSQLQDLLDGGAQFAGIRAECASPISAASVLDGNTRLVILP